MGIIEPANRQYGPQYSNVTDSLDDILQRPHFRTGYLLRVFCDSFLEFVGVQDLDRVIATIQHSLDFDIGGIDDDSA